MHCWGSELLALGGHGDELPPGLVSVQVVLEQILRRSLRLDGRVMQSHLRLFDRLAAFPVIASLARADEIFPGVPTAAVLGQHVVERQLFGAGTTVLAGELIAEEDLAAGEADSRARPLNEVVQPNDGRHAERTRRRAEDEAVDLEHLSFAAVDENERAAWMAHVERLVILVQNEHLPHVGLLTC